MGKNKYRSVVLLIVFIMYTVVFGTRISIGVTIPALIQEFGISNTEAGALSSFFFMGYFLTQVPAGFWIARFGSRTLVGVSLGFMALFLWLFGSMKTLAWASIYRLGLGITQGPVSVGGNSVIGQWFPPREQSRAISVMVASTMLAPILFPPICSWFIVEWGWRALFQTFGAVSLVVSACWLYFIHSSPEQSPRCSASELAEIRANIPAKRSASQPSGQTPWNFNATLAGTVSVVESKRELVRSRDLWWTTLSYFFFVCVFYGMITWLPFFFVRVRGYDLIEMGWLSAVPWLGALVGSLLGGWLMDHYLSGNPLPIITSGSLMTAVSLFFFSQSPVNLSWTIFYLLFFGFFVGLTPAGYMTFPIRMASRNVYPVAMSVMNSGGNVGGFLAPLLAGILLDAFDSFSVVFYFFIACSLLASLISLAIRRPVTQ